MKKREGISKRLRFLVFRRDGYTCVYCGAMPPQVQLHVDHIRPVASGGTNAIWNLVTACAPCNLGKGTLSPETPARSSNKYEDMYDGWEDDAQVATCDPDFWPELVV